MGNSEEDLRKCQSILYMKLLEIYFIFNWKYDCGDSSSRGENLSGDKRVEKCNQL